jgi:hypothetical protein
MVIETPPNLLIEGLHVRSGDQFSGAINDRHIADPAAMDRQRQVFLPATANQINAGSDPTIQKRYELGMNATTVSRFAEF